MSGTKAQDTYLSWLKDDHIDPQTKLELQAIADQTAEIEDRFYTDLEFGTGGLRGVMGAGTNRMNIYTIGRATQGFAQFLLQQPASIISAKDHSGKSHNQSVRSYSDNSHSDNSYAHNSYPSASHSAVIAYDSRNQSPEFALEAALVFAGNGIATYVFEQLRPTPELSFAVRSLQASAGIVITASHNPPEYNGYKIYSSDGGQLVPELAAQVTDQIGRISSLAEVRRMPREQAEAKGLLRWIGQDMDQEYIQALTSISRNENLIRQMSPLFRIVYTPLHGAGNVPVRQALQAVGFTQVHVVPEQEQPDPNFSTVASPNPEEKEAFTLAIKLAERIDADLIIGTDPDCDRMGAVVKNKQGDYLVLSGNQSGAIMINYLLGSMREQGDLPANGIVIKTIVTSEMGAAIARHFGMKTIDTLTGFKYIGEKITRFEQSGTYRFVFGYEESYGYLAGTYARDKDAVVASMLICEAAAYYKKQGKTLCDVLDDLYEQFGYFNETLQSRTLKGKDGIEQINAIMEDWRTKPPLEIDGCRVTEFLDYSKVIDDLPLENVLKFKLEDGSWFCLRPSGTEPKIKIYFAVCGTSQSAASNQMKSLVQAVMARVDK